MAIGTLAAIGMGLAGAGSIASGIMGSKSADKAAQAQVQSADAAAQVQREALAQQQSQYDTSRADTLAQYGQQREDILGQYKQSREDTLGFYNTGREDLAPYRGVGSNALLALSDQLGIARPAGSEGTNTGNPQFREDPGYKFAFDEGMRAVDARFPGMSKSGAKAKALTQFGQGTADQQYGNWLARLSGLASVGQTATGQSASLAGNASNTLAGASPTNALNAASPTNALNSLGQANSAAIGNYASNTGNLLQNAGAARASGYVGSNNAWSGAANNLASLGGMFMGGGFGGGSTGGGYNAFNDPFFGT